MTSIVGAHVSAAGGVQNAIKNAVDLGVTNIQIFGSSPKQYQVRHPLGENIQEFIKLRKENKIEKVFLHAPYLVNLASVNPRVRHMSRTALTGHLKICEDLEADGVIFHIGSVGKDGDKDEGIENIVKGMKKVLEATKSATLILENGSGGGGKLGTEIEEIASIVKKVKSQRVKVCIDTAHIFAGGVLKFEGKNIEEFIKKCDKLLGKNIISVMHINDSKAEFESYLDRHENIGHGFIGKKGFELLAKNKYCCSIPWILEVPGFEGQGPDEKNVKMLKNILGEK